MGKTRLKISASLREKWVQQFERKQDALQYEPFIKTQDFSSSGIRSRIPCINEARRVYHTMSFNESLTLLELLRNPDIIEIKEQYPFINVEKSAAFAKELGIKHPRYRGSKTDAIITWDFLCTRLDGSKKVISVKPKSELLKPRVQEKLELEKALAESEGYEYIIVTDEEVRTEKSRNLQRVIRGANLPSELNSIYRVWLKAFSQCIEDLMHEDMKHSIAKVASKLELTYSQSLLLMQHGFWLQDLVSNDSVPLHLRTTPFKMGVRLNDQY